MAAAQLPNFEQTILPHLNAAYNLARWITRNSHEAEDLAQESYIKAYRFFSAFRGGDGRGWLLAIVRNTCLTWVHKTKSTACTQLFDERIHSTSSIDAERRLMISAQADLIRARIEELPREYRDALIMRELEEMSYKEIAQATGVPIGTVMSRISRARKQLEHRLPAESMRPPAHPGWQ
jgi:RNA polymerase sigma-70 factor (ECF subfamily)